MKIFKNFGILVSSLSMGILSFSCVSTEIVEPKGSDSQKGDEITLRFSTPKKLATRADDSHKLRYVAKLFKMKTSQAYDPSSMQRQEIIEDVNKADNVITFNVDPDQNYIIFLFADYIPAASQPSNNLYPDYYYNTQSQDELVTMLPNPDNTSSKISTKFFNNDYYDCFSWTDTIHKTTLKRELDCCLNRAVAKIRFIDENAKNENFSNITFSSFSYLTQFNQQSQIGLGYSNLTATDLREISLTEMSSPNDHELFFFYTLAANKNSSVKSLKDVTFTTTNSDNNTKQTQIQAYTIPIAKNFITTVKGSFLPLNNTQEPDPGNQNDNSIILNVSTNGEWGSDQDFNITQ